MRGATSRATRLLYDLQRASQDHDRPLHRIDLAAWALSLGRRPLKRDLSNQHEVLALRYLRKAQRVLTKVALEEAA